MLVVIAHLVTNMATHAARDIIRKAVCIHAGPSAYNASGGLGRQQLSERKTLPQWRMGTERRFASAGARQCAAVPGPGQARSSSTL